MSEKGETPVVPETAREMLDLLFPEHDRTSCDDPGRGNQWPNEWGYARCARCALLVWLDGQPPYEGLRPRVGTDIRWVGPPPSHYANSHRWAHV